MKAGELMSTDVVTLKESDPIEEAFDLMVGEHIRGAPVIGSEGELIGIVSQLDIYFGKMTREGKGGDKTSPLLVRDVMTSPAVAATEETDITDLSRMMYKLRIHRIPVVRGTEVCGIVSSLDICEAIASGRLVSKEK